MNSSYFVRNEEAIESGEEDSFTGKSEKVAFRFLNVAAVSADDDDDI